MKSEFVSASHKEGWNLVGSNCQEVLDFFKDSIYTIRVVESRYNRPRRPRNTIDVVVKDGKIAETLMY
jgi:hypothetical protein